MTGDIGSARHPSRLGLGSGGPRRRRSWLALGGVLGSVALLTGILAFGLSRDPGVVGSALIGRPAPDFALETLQGDATVRLAELRGQVVVVNFWASWCRECRVEHPDLVAAWERYRDRGVVFLGIAFQDRPSASRAYVEDVGGGWPTLADPGSRAAIAYGVFGIPETFVIDRSGLVGRRYVGPVRYDDLTHDIDRFLREA